MPKPNPLSRAINKSKKHEEAASEKKIALVEQPKAKASAREGRVLVGGHFAPEVSTQLKVIAAEKRTTVQALLAEAINMLFAKHGKPEVADLTTGA